MFSKCKHGNIRNFCCKCNYGHTSRKTEKPEMDLVDKMNHASRGRMYREEEYDDQEGGEV